HDLARKQLIIPKDIANAFEGVQYALSVNGFSVAEFSANRDLALRLGLVGQQPGRHLAGIDHNERRVEQGRYAADLSTLHGIRNRMKRCAESEAAFVSARVNVDDDAHLRKDAGLNE